MMGLHHVMSLMMMTMMTMLVDFYWEMNDVCFVCFHRDDCYCHPAI